MVGGEEGEERLMEYDVDGGDVRRSEANIGRAVPVLAIVIIPYHSLPGFWSLASFYGCCEMLVYSRATSRLLECRCVVLPETLQRSTRPSQPWENVTTPKAPSRVSTLSKTLYS